MTEIRYLGPSKQVLSGAYWGRSQRQLPYLPEDGVCLSQETQTTGLTAEIYLTVE